MVIGSGEWRSVTSGGTRSSTSACRMKYWKRWKKKILSVQRVVRRRQDEDVGVGVEKVAAVAGVEEDGALAPTANKREALAWIAPRL